MEVFQKDKLADGAWKSRHFNSEKGKQKVHTYRYS